MQSPVVWRSAKLALRAPPELVLCRNIRTLGSRAESRVRTAGVSSVEASSETTISRGGRDCASAASIAASTMAARLYVAIATVRYM